MKKIICLALVLLLIAACPFSAVCRAASPLKTAAEETASALAGSPGAFEAGSGDWLVLCLVRSGIGLTASQKKAYLQSVDAALEAGNGVLSRLGTDTARTVIGLTAAGCDASSYKGYDLTLSFADYDATVRQGLNGAVWALIALDCGEYDVPACADASRQASRERYIACILDRELPGGGFAFSGKAADPDMTAMCITALSRYSYRADVRSALSRAVRCLSSLQREDGGFASYGIPNAESAAQVLIAMTSMGISPDDARFVKNGHTVPDALLSYRLDDGSFAHQADGGSSGLASVQALEALAALLCAEEGGTLYGIVPPAFPDTASHASREAVTVLSAAGILGGFSDGTFRPDETMTRAQFSAILVRALHLKASGAAPFSDVSDGAWYTETVAAAYENGLITGRTESHFDPEGTVSTVEAEIILARAGKLVNLSVSAPKWTADSPAITRGEIALRVYALLRSAGKV